MPLIRLKKATPGNIVLIDFSSKHEVGKSSEKRVNLLRQIVGMSPPVVMYGHIRGLMRGRDQGHGSFFQGVFAP